MSEWQAIETAPKDGTRVLLYDRFEREPGFERFVGRWVPAFAPFPEHWSSVPGAYHKRPTHWHPLPEPPP